MVVRQHALDNLVDVVAEGGLRRIERARPLVANQDALVDLLKHVLWIVAVAKARTGKARIEQLGDLMPTLGQVDATHGLGNRERVARLEARLSLGNRQRAEQRQRVQAV